VYARLNLFEIFSFAKQIGLYFWSKAFLALNSMRLKDLVLNSLFFMLFYISYLVEFAQVFVMASILALILVNLGERKEGELSAYSIFNKGFQTLLGQLTGEQIDRDLRNRKQHSDSEDENEHAVLGRVQQQPVFKPVKRGKKARRNYEERKERKAQMRMQQLPDAWEEEFND